MTLDTTDGPYIEQLEKERDRWRELQHSAAQCLVNRIKESEARGLEIDQLRGTLSLAEEGLANYAQENAALSDALSAANSDAVRLHQEMAQLRDALNQAKERAYAEYGRLCEAVRPEPQSAGQEK